MKLFKRWLFLYSAGPTIHHCMDYRFEPTESRLQRGEVPSLIWLLSFKIRKVTVGILTRDNLTASARQRRNPRFFLIGTQYSTVASDSTITRHEPSPWHGLHEVESTMSTAYSSLGDTEGLFKNFAASLDRSARLTKCRCCCALLLRLAPTLFSPGKELHCWSALPRRPTAGLPTPGRPRRRCPAGVLRMPDRHGGLEGVGPNPAAFVAAVR